MKCFLDSLSSWNEHGAVQRFQNRAVAHPTVGCTLACFLNTGLWNLGIRIRNGAYTAFSAMWSTGLLTGGGRDIVSGAGSGSMENSKRVCGPVCRGLRDVPTFPPSLGFTGRNGCWSPQRQVVHLCLCCLHTWPFCWCWFCPRAFSGLF